MEKVEESIRQVVKNQEVDITKVELEAATVVVYTKDADIFARDNRLVRKMSHKVRRKVEIRPDSSILADVAFSEKKIREIVPEDAEITNIYFQPIVHEVIIEAKSPGLVIGKHGHVLNKIKEEIGWIPKAVRTPPMESKTIENIRQYLRKESEERLKFLKEVAKNINKECPPKSENWVRMTALGGYREVGRSCTLVSTRESRILVDCGLGVSNTNKPDMSPYIYVNEVLPLNSIDAVIVTHAHLDHSGFVPGLFKYGYDGPVYCTAPTRDLMSLLQLDYLKVSNADGRKPPYTSEHIRKMVLNTITLEYEETCDITCDVKLTLRNAGHILGSSIVHLHVNDGLFNLVFTGDMKYENTWLFDKANAKFPRMEGLVIESTYGGRNDFQPTREKAKEMLCEIVRTTIEQGGSVLIPVFAVGRSQEVMLVLEEAMSFGQIPKVKVYLDGMIWEATAIHTAYPGFLNNTLSKRILHEKKNPFLSEIFERVDSATKRKEICNRYEPCIVLATSGMLNGGPVMDYLSAWASESINTLIFVGYQAEGSLGRKLQTRGARMITILNNGRREDIEVNMSIETCEGFSGHSDRKQLIKYMRKIKPRPEKVIFVHGDEGKCLELSSAVYKKLKLETVAPKNLETIRFR
ncbi:MAG TPA: beta-CASP ribonuclease aCPSF1 [Thermoplasmata archaeon]|nr:beta-CASP ribonuclease aCPSF1 [Thermoplasmata archaeon]